MAAPTVNNPDSVGSRQGTHICPYTTALAHQNTSRKDTWRSLATLLLVAVTKHQIKAAKDGGVIKALGGGQSTMAEAWRQDVRQLVTQQQSGSRQVSPDAELIHPSLVSPRHQPTDGGEERLFLHQFISSRLVS